MENSSLKIKRLPYSRMLKSEMADYVEKTIDIVEAHDLESVIIDPVFNLLNNKSGEVELLRVSYGIDTLRLKANKLKADMMLQISAFKIKVKLLKRSNLALDLHVIENAVNSHLTYLNKCKNDKQLNQKVGGFFDLLKSSVDLSGAIGEHNLLDETDAMRVAYLNVNFVWQQRVKLLAKRPTIDTQKIVKGMSAAINDLFKGVEVAHLMSVLSDNEDIGSNIEVEPLINELNQLSEMYYKSISIRDANNKRKAEEEKERNPVMARTIDWTDEYGNPTEDEDANMENLCDEEYDEYDDEDELEDSL